MWSKIFKGGCERFKHGPKPIPTPMLTLINSDSNILQNPIELQLFLRQAIQFAIVMFDDKFFIFFLFLFQVGPSSNVTHMVSQNTRRSINICGVAIEFCIGHPL